ncbi:MAG: TolC family protein [Planctomycetaceae bacterium]|nr:TolC family protein [Planctomycetaceae bacterium]
MSLYFEVNMRPPYFLSGLTIFALALPAGCVQTPSVVPNAELAQRIAPAGLEPGDSGGARGSPSAPPSEAAAERPPNAPASGGRAEPPSSPGMAACGEAPLTLDEAKQLALHLNPQLKVAREAIATAQGNEEVAFSGYLPSFQANTGFQAFASQVGRISPQDISRGTERGRLPNLPVRGFGPGHQDFDVTEVQMKWVIWQFGRQFARHGQSLLNLDIARLQYERARQAMEFDVSQAFYQVLQTRAALVLAEQAGVRAEAFLKDARDLLRQGAQNREYIARAEAQVKEVNQQISDARSAAQLAVATLNRAIGLNVNAPTEVVERQEPPPIFDLSLKDCLQLAVDHRPEFLVVQKGILAAESDVTIARAEFLPTITAHSVYSNVTGTGVENANVGTGGIFVNLELYTGGRRKGRLDTARAEVRTACAQAQQICDGIAYETHVAYHGVKDAHPRILLAEAAVAQARENLRLINNRYRTGGATLTEVIDAQTALDHAEQSVNTAYHECRTAQARLEYVVGTPIALPPRPLAPPTPSNVVAPLVFPPPLPTTRAPFALPQPFRFLAPSPAPLPTPFAPPGTGQPGLPAQPPYIAPSPIPPLP